MNDQQAFAIALEEAHLSYHEGGVPVGAALVATDGKLLGRGHNMRVQNGSPLLHGETAALENSGRLPASAYRGATMYTTLSPCDMCTGGRQESVGCEAAAYKKLACLLYGISRVVIGENKTFLGGEAYLKQRGVEVVVMDHKGCQELMEKFIKEKPQLWNEDIGEEERVYCKEQKKGLEIAQAK